MNELLLILEKKKENEEEFNYLSIKSFKLLIFSYFFLVTI